MKTSTNSKIKLPVLNGYVFLDCEDVLMLNAEGNYTRIITVEKDEYFSSYNLGRLYKSLNTVSFYKVNRSCILNTNYLRSIDNKQKLATINVNDELQKIPVSNAFIQNFNKTY